MTVLGAHVPISGWTVVPLVVGVALTLGYGRSLARRTGWHPEATLVALFSLTALLALTITPDGDDPPIPLRECVPLDPQRLVYNALHTGGGPGADLLNSLLPLPFALAWTVAAGRGYLVAAVAVTLPAVIELLQTLLPGRNCSITDYLANSVGGLVGVGLGLLVGAAVRSGGRTPGGP